MYSFRYSLPVVGMIVYVLETPCKLPTNCFLLQYDHYRVIIYVVFAREKKQLFYSPS